MIEYLEMNLSFEKENELELVLKIDLNFDDFDYYLYYCLSFLKC